MLKSKNHIVFNTVFFTIVFMFSSIFATYGSDQKSAEKFLNDGDYTAALPLFKELNLLYPNDASYQYGYGACLTQTGNIGQKAKKILLQAAQGNVPEDVYYYIAKNYHGQKNFETAITYYERFEEEAPKKLRKRFDAEEMVQACKEQTVPFEVKPEVSLSRPLNALTEDAIADEPDPIDVEDSASANLTPMVEEGPTETSLPDSSIAEVVESKDTIVAEKKVEIADPTVEAAIQFPDTFFNFTINPEVQYRMIDQFKTAKGRESFIQAWNNDQQLNSILDKIKKLREDYEKSDNDQAKASIASEVVKLEQTSISLKSEVDAGYLKSNQAEVNYWAKASDTAVEKLKMQNDSIEAVIMDKLQPAEQEPMEQAISNMDSLLSQTDSLQSTDSIQTVEEEQEINNIFYRIQVGAYSKGLPEYIDRLYKKLSVLRKIDHYTDDNGITVYTIGKVSNWDDALKLQAQIRQEGVKDAFVVAYNNGKRITLKEAKELTKK